MTSFAISAGLFLALMGVVAAWLFRTASAPLAMKLAVPSLIVALACVTPSRVAALLGYPTFVPFTALPKQAELLAVVPHDEDKRVDLLLRQGSELPRLYEVILTDDMKKLLKEAGEKLNAHERVGLVKRKGPKRPPGVMDIETPEAPYVLDDSVWALPSKGGEQ